MRFIVALVLLVAVANAKIVKEGGLKGSWFDTIVLTSDDDTTAPSIDFTDTVNNYWSSWYALSYDPPYVGANITGGTYDYGYFNFRLTSGDQDTSGGCDMMLTLGDGTDGVYDNTITCTSSSYCYGDDDCYSTCSTGYYVKAGAYDSWLTCWDGVGNWAMWGTEDIGAVMIYNNEVDFMAPMLTNAAVSVDSIEIPEGSSRDDTWTVDISVDVYDNDLEDDWASGIGGVWITVVDQDDNSMDLALFYDSVDVGTWVYTYGTTVTVYNWAEPNVYTITMFTAVDKAGNWATPADDGWTLTVTALAEDDVANCQTFDSGITSLSSSDGTIDVSGDPSTYYWQYFRLGCTTKFGDTTDNYAAVSFMGPAVTLAGDTMMTMMYLSDAASILPPVDMVPSSLGYTTDAVYVYPAYYSFTDLLGDAYWSSYMTFYNGWASGDYTLYEVWTFTDTGSAQRYNADAGSASSVVPSLMVVAVAAVATLFHL
jgi:hypothetical protein